MCIRDRVVFAILFIFASALVVDWFFTAPQSLPLLPDGKLTDAKSKAIDIMITRSNLIANWNIGTIAACTYILLNGAALEVKKSTLVFVFLSIVTAFYSVFFAQNIMDIVTRTLFADQDVVYSKNLLYSSSAQYLFTGISLLLFVGSVFTSKLVENLK